MKRKLLFAALCVVSVLGLRAQTDVFKDVTSTYLTNADFEGEYSVYSNPSSDRAIYQPTGWTVSYTSGDSNDITSLNSSCTQWSQFSGKAQLAEGGNNTYWIRMRWGTGATLELSQSITLPLGNYSLTAAYYKNGTGGDGWIFVNSTDKNNGTNEDAWKSLSIDFASDGSATTKLGCRAKHTNTYEKFLAFDNFVLKWNLTQSLASLITSAEEVYNEDKSNTALKNAIDEAKTHQSSNDADELETAYNDLSAAASLSLKRKAWKTAKDAAEAAIANDTYANVTGEEKTNLQAEIDKAEPTTGDGYDSAKSALETATTTFTDAKANYDAFVAAKTAGNPSLTYASSDKLAALTTAKAASATSSSDAVTKTTAITTALRAYYESHALAEGVAVAVDKTNLLTNYTNPTNISGWDVNNTTGDCKLRTMSSEPYTNSDETTATGYFDTNSWGTAFASTVTQNVNLAVGKYLLTVKARGNGTTTYQVTAGTKYTDITTSGNTGGVFGRGWNDFSVEFEVETAGEVTIGMNLETGASSNWLSFGDFRLVKLDATLATAEDYENLNTAISTAEAKTLGFDEGEYAPYNNVEALTKLAEAKAINQSANNVQEEIQTLTGELNAAGWTANDSEVNAIYDGTFAIQPEHTTGPTALLGWNNPEGIRQLIKNTETYPGLNSATDKAAVFAWGNTTMTYGNTAGYTLPLNAYTLYELSFKSCGWADGDMGYVNVDIKNSSNEGLQTVATKTATKRIKESAPWDEFKILFVTGEAGNYKLGMWTSKHTTFTDIVLKKAVSQTLTFAEDGSTPKFAAGTYPTVSLARTFSTANYSTLVLPFAMNDEETAAAFAEAYTLTGVEGESLKFEAATEIAAGTPYLVKANAAKLSVTGKAIDPATTVTNTVKKSKDEQTTATFVGTFVGETLTDADTDAWVVSNNNLYNVNSDVTVGAYRGYFTVTSTTPVKALNLDLEGTDGIGALRNAENETVGNAIFNLAGQRINKLQKGVNIINGKKVLVK